MATSGRTSLAGSWLRCGIGGGAGQAVVNTASGSGRSTGSSCGTSRSTALQLVISISDNARHDIVVRLSERCIGDPLLLAFGEGLLFCECGENLLGDLLAAFVLGLQDGQRDLAVGRGLLGDGHLFFGGVLVSNRRFAPVIEGDVAGDKTESSDASHDVEPRIHQAAPKSQVSMRRTRRQTS